MQVLIETSSINGPFQQTMFDYRRVLVHQCGKDEYPPVIVCITIGKSPCSMDKSTISMAVFNSYVKLPGGMFHDSMFSSWVGPV